VVAIVASEGSSGCIGVMDAGKVLSVRMELVQFLFFAAKRKRHIVLVAFDLLRHALHGGALMDVAAGIVHASVIPPFALSVIDMSVFSAVTPTVLKRTIIAVSVAVPLMMSSA